MHDDIHKNSIQCLLFFLLQKLRVGEFNPRQSPLVFSLYSLVSFSLCVQLLTQLHHTISQELEMTCLSVKVAWLGKDILMRFIISKMCEGKHREEPVGSQSH